MAAKAASEPLDDYDYTAFWHWPNHQIGKRESARLREIHNKLADSHIRILIVLKSVEKSLRQWHTNSPAIMAELHAEVTEELRRIEIYGSPNVPRE